MEVSKVSASFFRGCSLVILKPNCLNHTILSSGSHDQTLIIWALDLSQKSVERMHVCRGHAGSVDAVCVSPDKSRFMSGSWDKSLKIWSTSLDPEPGEWN